MDVSSKYDIYSFVIINVIMSFGSATISLSMTMIMCRNAVQNNLTKTGMSKTMIFTETWSSYFLEVRLSFDCSYTELLKPLFVAISNYEVEIGTE